mmetsp:Transcript_9494/g.22371  ORF Transcript_9494/g.22371 Transcript_9494/m.22371 type:complete len:168 (-) Transcript_9494:41-544(-)
MMTSVTSAMAHKFCGGSSRRLIAGWWYSILAMTGILALMSCVVMGSRSFAEAFVSFWSAAMLLGLSIGGTMIMRKFHNSMAVGFFMGGVLAMAQMFFFLSLVYTGYKYDEGKDGFSGAQEGFMSLLCLVECILLGSFAAILGAHRSDLMDKNDPNTPEEYNTPYVQS